MNTKTRNEFATMGLEILKRSVLLVLYDARDERIPYLQPKEIGERLGIPPTRWERDGHNALILSILNHLDEEDLVEKTWIGVYKWGISEEKIKVIEGGT